MSFFALPILRRLHAVAGAALLVAIAGSVARADWPSDGLPVAAGPHYQRGPVGLTVPGGGVWAFWIDLGPDATHSVFTQRLTIAGTPSAGWPAGGRGVVDPRSVPVTLQCVSDGAGGALLAWFDRRNDGMGIRATRVDAAGALMPGWEASGAAVCTTFVDGYGPLDQLVALCPDGAGGAFVAWSDTRNTPHLGPLVYDVYGQHLRGDGTLDPAWPVAGRALVTGPGFKYPHGLVTADAGDFWLASENALDTSKLSVTRFAADGDSVAGWSPPSFSTRPAMTGDGVGGVFLAWQDCRDCGQGVEGIYAVRLHGSAQPVAGWAPDGVVVVAEPVDEELPVITATGNAAMIAWRRHETGHGESFEARRIEADGRFWDAWSAPRTFATIDVGLLWPLIAPDGDGGAMFAFRRNTPNVFGSRLTHGGDMPPAFPDTGLALCSVSGQQDPVALVSDGRNGAVVFWEDRRNPANVDIYAMRFTRDGDVGSTSGVPPSAIYNAALELSPPAPNPAHGSLTVQLTVPVAARVRVDVLDLAGRLVVTLRDQTFPAGTRAVTWDGRDKNGRAARAGVYLMRARMDGEEVARRVVRIP